MMISRWDRQQRRLVRSQRPWRRRKIFRWLLIGLAIVAILPPLFFHFKLRRFRQMRLQKCHWLKNPPLVCAHGGDSSKAFPNTMDAYRIALQSQVDCIEIDASRSLDGALFALHDRNERIIRYTSIQERCFDFHIVSAAQWNCFLPTTVVRELQRISGNKTSRVGHLNMKEIEELHTIHHLPLELRDLYVPTIEEALKFVSGSVRQVILDAKVGPPSYEKGLAKDILTVLERTKCKNCLVWAKSDSLARDVMKQSPDVTVGYIVMMDPSSGTRTKLLRMKGAGVVGVYHPLVDEKLVKIVHGRKKKVYAWTVDDETSMQKMLTEQVDAIVTSNPSLLQRLMQAMRTKCLEEGFSLSS